MRPQHAANSKQQTANTGTQGCEEGNDIGSADAGRHTHVRLHNTERQEPEGTGSERTAMHAHNLSNRVILRFSQSGQSTGTPQGCKHEMLQAQPRSCTRCTRLGAAALPQHTPVRQPSSRRERHRHQQHSLRTPSPWNGRTSRRHSSSCTRGSLHNHRPSTHAVRVTPAQVVMITSASTQQAHSTHRWLTLCTWTAPRNQC